MATVPLSQIPSIALLYKLNKLEPSHSTESSATSKYNDIISLIRTDITKLQVTAIVNAANNSLLGGGGVDGAIHRAAGPQLLSECETLNGCDTGDAKMTEGYRLPARKVVHCVGPVYRREGKRGSERLLGECYRKSLDLVSGVEDEVGKGEGEEGVSVAFSALSTGVYGYPSDEAAEVAVRTVRKWLEDDEERAKKISRIIFCNFMEKDERAYHEVVPRHFPPAQEENDVAEEDVSAVDEQGLMKERDAGEFSSEIPDLPDVPTKGPTEDGQPEAKKAKLSSDD